MDSSNSLLQVDGLGWAEDASVRAVAPDELRPAAVLKGTARGLEAVVYGRATTEEIALALVSRLDEAPGFFRGSDVRVRVEEGPLPAGCLGRLDEIATRFGLRIIELVASRPALLDTGAVPVQNLATGSAPSPATSFEDEPTNSAAAAYVESAPVPELSADHPLTLSAADAALDDAALDGAALDGAALDDAALLTDVIDELATSFEEPTNSAIPLSLSATPEIELETVSEGTRLVVGPVRSGVILEHTGHLIVFGDVNPGAEIRAKGNIVVLGRLRGTAHAGIGQEVGFILALRLEPQQLRIGRQVARAADSDIAAAESEIAYGTGDKIVVERYQGRLPRDLATSI